MIADIYSKDKITREVEFSHRLENIYEVEIVSNTAILRNNKTHYFDLDIFALSITNDK